MIVGIHNIIFDNIIACIVLKEKLAVTVLQGIIVIQTVVDYNTPLSTSPLSIIATKSYTGHPVVVEYIRTDKNTTGSLTGMFTCNFNTDIRYRDDVSFNSYIPATVNINPTGRVFVAVCRVTIGGYIIDPVFADCSVASLIIGIRSSILKTDAVNSDIVYIMDSIFMDGKVVHITIYYQSFA